MKVNKITLTLHTVFSGLIAVFLSMFLASGSIGENYTDDTFVAPIFFLIIVIWVIGVLFLAFKKFHTSIKVMWLSIPLGLLISFPLAIVL
ncbi:hypothetical protein [Oceanobacillus sp. J11TS1]|uniref:hypothetical protein n=1 Tax=Oceanobacillus sp. J11TS1 TaxID=2807191 RepID=UPI001B15C131|nr:hypothetical protein [Oceanobacillus sp. J11TS1]GIO25274.1 hypothetical protein J11TS1_38550 [Oceanobacillus sp. J11TS1]